MPRLVHLAPASRRRGIERSGIRGESTQVYTGNKEPETLSRAVFAMPILPDFSVTYQWLRELRRWHHERMLAVHFVAPSDEDVWVGRYNKPHEKVSLGAAVRRVTEDPAGNEIILTRSIRKNEIASVRELTQLVGWTETPEPSTFDCLCRMCVRAGTPDLMRRVRAAFERHVLEARQALESDDVVRALSRLDLPLERARGRLTPDKLLAFVRSPERDVRRVATSLLGNFKWAAVETALAARLRDEYGSVREAAVRAMIRSGGVRRAHAHVAKVSDDLVTSTFVEHLEYGHDIDTSARLLTEIARSGSSQVVSRVARAAAELMRDDEASHVTRALLSSLRPGT